MICSRLIVPRQTAIRTLPPNAGTTKTVPKKVAWHMSGKESFGNSHEYMGVETKREQINGNDPRTGRMEKTMSTGERGE
jgi:hypothetical protein